MWPSAPHLSFYHSLPNTVPYNSPEASQEGTKETPPTNEEAPPPETGEVLSASPTETTPTNTNEAPPTDRSPHPSELPVEEQLSQEETDISGRTAASCSYGYRC